MNFRKIITLFSLFFSVGILSGCNSANDNPSGGGSEEPAHVHSYVVKSTAEKYLASAADCTHPAKYYFSCECGEASTETFESGEALGHKWHQEVAEKYISTAATCTDAANYFVSCERCGEKSTETFTSGAALGHKWHQEVAEKYLAAAADCTHAAKYYYSCETCGTAWTETFEHGEALGHKWHEEVSAKYLADSATCQSRAYYYYSCEVCGEPSTEKFGVGDCLAHSYTKVIVGTDTLASAATCTSPAYYYMSCEYCGEVSHDHKTSVGDPLGHEWDEVADTAYLVSGATCLDKAVYHVTCTRCHEEHPTRTFEHGSPLGHEFTNYVSNGDATCTHDGTETAHCNHEGCDVTDTRVDEDSMLDHELVSEKNVKYLKTAASCLNDAVYYKHCENCDHISEETFEDTGSSLGHEYNPITGHCIHAGCEESIAIKETVNYGDGTFTCEDSPIKTKADRNKKLIYELTFNGKAASTNVVVGLYHGSGTGVYASNASVNFYDEDGNEIARNQLSYTTRFSLEDGYANGKHIYAHITIKSTDFDDLYLRFSTHQYTGLEVVARKPATCVTPIVNAHIDFDQSEETGTWLDSNATQEKAQSTFIQGSSGTGHEMIHYDATAATITSPALKEHWFCENCGGYYLTAEGTEEVAYEEIYNNTLYGSVINFYNVTGRGTVIKVRITVDKGETPIDSNDDRYINKTGSIIVEDGTYSQCVLTGITVNLHVAEFLFRGANYTTLVEANPKAFFLNL